MLLILLLVVNAQACLPVFRRSECLDLPANTHTFALTLDVEPHEIIQHKPVALCYSCDQGIRYFYNTKLRLSCSKFWICARNGMCIFQDKPDVIEIHPHETLLRIYSNRTMYSPQFQPDIISCHQKLSYSSCHFPIIPAITP